MEIVLGSRIDARSRPPSVHDLTSRPGFWVQTTGCALDGSAALCVGQLRGADVCEEAPWQAPS